MFRHVMVGVDGGPASRDAIAIGRLLAASGAGVSLAHIHVLTPVRGGSGAYGGPETEQAMRLLEQVRDAAGVDAELLPLTASSVGRGLHYLAEEHGADLLCVGSNPRSLVGRVLLGDATRASLVGAPCAVAVAPLGYSLEQHAIATIGVGYDALPDSEAALAAAREISAQHGARIRALTVVEPAPLAALARRESLEQLRSQAQAGLDPLDGVEGEVAFGVAAEELAAFGGSVDLLVIGSRGYGPIRRLMLGTASTQLVASARCPLLVMPRAAGAE